MLYSKIDCMLLSDDLKIYYWIAPLTKEKVRKLLNKKIELECVHCAKASLMISNTETNVDAKPCGFNKSN